jgi:hypothetical protein
MCKRECLRSFLPTPPHSFLPSFRPSFLASPSQDRIQKKTKRRKKNKKNKPPKLNPETGIHNMEAELKFKEHDKLTNCHKLSYMWYMRLQFFNNLQKLTWEMLCDVRAQQLLLLHHLGHEFCDSFLWARWE